MDEIGKKDQNSATVLMGVTDDSNQYIRMLRVDPITNRLLVSGTGGGGGSGYQQPLTGTVDGVNATFTWATAPNVIVVDEGRTMQKVTADLSTTNWSGTTTTVLSVAPTYDIFSPA